MAQARLMNGHLSGCGAPIGCHRLPRLKRPAVPLLGSRLVDSAHAQSACRSGAQLPCASRGRGGLGCTSKCISSISSSSTSSSYCCCLHGSSRCGGGMCSSSKPGASRLARAPSALPPAAAASRWPAPGPAGPACQQQQQQQQQQQGQQQQEAQAQARQPSAARRRRGDAAVVRATFAANAGDDDALNASPDFVEATTGWRRRWTVVLLCFVAFTLCNMDRVNMSVAILPMSQQYAWDSKTVGLVQSSFFWGYLLTQVLGGIWADRFGGKLVLGMGVIWWSMATALTPLAAQAGLPVLLVARALMGIGEGVAMPAMNNMLSKWVPVAERSRSLALVYTGMFLGCILGLGLSPHMIKALGWPSVFYIFGSMGVVWFMAWRNWAASTPRDDPMISPEEKEYILANTSSSSKARSIPWGKLLSRKEVWALIVCHFCHNWGTFILLSWMPTYYNQVLGLDVMASGIFSVLPWITMAVTANVGGWIADTLVSRGVSVTTVRKVMQTLGFLGPAFFLTQLSSVTNVAGAVACMMGAQGFDAFSQSGLYSNHQDIGPKYAGVLLGLSNTAGVLAGVLGSLATGWILAHGTWADVWRVAVALYLVGTVVWNLFTTGERIFD